MVINNDPPHTTRLLPLRPPHPHHWLYRYTIMNQEDPDVSHSALVDKLSAALETSLLALIPAIELDPTFFKQLLPFYLRKLKDEADHIADSYGR